MLVVVLIVKFYNYILSLAPRVVSNAELNGSNNVSRYNGLSIRKYLSISDYKFLWIIE
jgi:hypothetical protein